MSVSSVRVQVGGPHVFYSHKVMDRLVLSTARLMVREMSPSDLLPLAAILQDDGVMYAYGGAFSAAETEAWLDKQLRRYAELGFGLWAVCLNDTGEMIGQCGITMQEYNDLTVPEIGYLFARRHWHNGYAAEAAMACRCYGMANLHFNRLYSIIRITNVASQKVAFRIGMRPEGTIVRHYRGQYMRHIVFSAGID